MGILKKAKLTKKQEEKINELKEYLDTIYNSKDPEKLINIKSIFPKSVNNFTPLKRDDIYDR